MPADWLAGYLRWHSAQSWDRTSPRPPGPSRGVTRRGVRWAAEYRTTWVFSEAHEAVGCGIESYPNFASGPPAAQRRPADEVW